MIQSITKQTWWTEVEIAKRREYISRGISPHQIAFKLNRTQQAVYCKVSELGIPIQKRKLA